MEEELADWFATYRERLLKRRHRGVVVLSGPADWGRDTAARLVAWMDGQGLWVGEHCPVAALFQCRGAGARQWLGRNLDLLVWDSHAGTHPSGFGAVSGALVGGGVLIWLAPPLSRWRQGPDPDYERLRRHRPPYRFLARMADILEDVTGDPPHALLTPETRRLHLPPETDKASLPPDGPTLDQAAAVDAILSLESQAHAAPLVLRADRGRGKSAALGMAASRLVLDRGLRVGVTAARPASLDSFWCFVPASCRDRIHFVAPDELLRRRPGLDVLLVDEAATLPVPMLAALVSRWPWSTLATTVNGYEGTGRGFDLRFRCVLDRDYPGWRELMLSEPIRWAADDPLEPLINRLLCLNADVPELQGGGGRIRYEKLDRDELLKDEGLLSDLMGLLVSAHYQTSPDDLRQILDDPETELWIAREGRTLVGVAWLLHEGGLDSELAESVWLGRRRPKGHLLAQSLAFQGGDPVAARLHYARVTRIAVHPERRRGGTGLELLSRVEEAASEMGMDVFGTSFGATLDLINFWESAGFQLLRVGTRRDAASGTHSAMMGKSLSAAGRRLCNDQQLRFARHWPWLEPCFREMAQPLKMRLEDMLPCVDEPTNALLEEADRRELQAFAYGHRELAVSRLPLNRLHRLSPTLPRDWKEGDRQLWQRAVVEGADWEQLRRETVTAGKRHGLERLRSLVMILRSGQD